MDGQRLTFRLMGLNNQNFIMEDEQTGSWWQQVTGEAIFGPLKGKSLELVMSDEVSFEIWKREHPQSRVLVSTAEAELSKKNFHEGLEAVKEFGLPMSADPNDVLPQRELIVGVELEGQSKAYPVEVLVKQNPVVDQIGEVPLLLVVARDGESIRCFDRRLDGATLEMYLKPGTEGPLVLIDSETGSEWDFSGRAIAGPMAGRSLQKIHLLKDFWFDWKIFHPETLVFRAGF